MDLYLKLDLAEKYSEGHGQECFTYWGIFPQYGVSEWALCELPT